jgi:hypothetical protein
MAIIFRTFMLLVESVEVIISDSFGCGNRESIGITSMRLDTNHELEMSEEFEEVIMIVIERQPCILSFS